MASLSRVSVIAPESDILQWNHCQGEGSEQIRLSVTKVCLMSIIVLLLKNKIRGEAYISLFESSVILEGADPADALLVSGYI